MGNTFLCCYWYQLLAVWNPQGDMYPQGLILYYYTQHTGTLLTLSFSNTHHVVFKYHLAFYIKQRTSWGCLYLIILVGYSVWLYFYLFNLPCDIFCMKQLVKMIFKLNTLPVGNSTVMWVTEADIIISAWPYSFSRHAPE